MPEELIDLLKYEQRVIKCNSVAWWWKTINWIVGIIGIGASAFAAARLFDEEKWAAFASVIATICFGFMGFASPLKNASNYDKSADRLELAIDRYKNRLIDLQAFLAEYEAARSITVGEGDGKLPVAPKAHST